MTTCTKEAAINFTIDDLRRRLTAVETSFTDIVGPSWTPVKNGKHAAVHQATIKRLLAEYAGTEVADTIAALVWWRTIDRNSFDHLVKFYQEQITNLHQEQIDIVKKDL